MEPIGKSTDSSGRIFRVKTAKDKAQELNPRKIRLMTDADIKALSIEEINELIEKWINLVKPKMISAMTPEQIKGITPRYIRKLSPEHIKALADNQLSALNGEHIAYLTHEQFASFTKEQVLGLAEMLSYGRPREEMMPSDRKTFLDKLSATNKKIDVGALRKLVAETQNMGDIPH